MTLQLLHLSCLFLLLSLHVLTSMEELIFGRLDHRVVGHCNCVKRIRCGMGNRRSYWLRRATGKPLNPSSCTLSMRLFVRFPQMAPIVVTWIVRPLGHQRRDVNLQKNGSNGGVPDVSSMIKSTKWWRKERKELAQLELHTFPSWGVFLFYIRISP